MPRARVPNARLIASADLPILPWLAPRVFAESPIPRRSDRHGSYNRAQKKTEKGASRGKSIRVLQRKSKDATSTWGCAAGSAGTRSQRTSTAGLLQTPLHANPRCQASDRHLQPSPLDLRYADISSFARQQSRSYATSRPVARRVAGRTRQLQPADRRTPTVRKASTIKQQQREKLLLLEQRRRAAYVARQSYTVEEHLLGQGQYRSLRRRLLNLRQWDATTVNLSHVDSADGGRSWLVRAFAALDRKIHWRMQRHTEKLTIKRDRACVGWSNAFYQATEEERLDRIVLEAENKTFYAQRLLIYLLDRRPGRALPFIQALADAPNFGGVPPEMLADALEFLAKIHADKLYGKREGWDHKRDALKRDFVAAFSRVFHQVLSNYPNICSQELLYNLVSLVGAKDLEAVFDMLVKARTRLGYDTLLHFATTFGEVGNFEYALKCLDKMQAKHDHATWQQVVHRERFRWVCAVILRKSMSKGQNYHETPGIVAAFVRLGVKMDTLLYNVVMHNAMEAGDYATAFKVYNALHGNGLKPDKHTFSILLHGCTLQSNPASFREFAEYCVEIAKEVKDPVLATDYLYYLYVRHHNRSDPERTLKILWRAYLNFFSATPLQSFANARHDLRSAIDQQGLLPADTLLAPTQVAIYIMLQAEIQAAMKISNQRVLNLYAQFKLLVTKGTDPTLLALSKKPVIWNAFLLAFGVKQQFASASQLIADMMARSPQPNIYTWNIFMQAFFRTGQVQAAERVFEIMRSRGEQPDQYTYGILLRGYAKAQLVGRIGETMQHVDEEAQLDPNLLKALARVVDRKRLMITLEQARTRKEAQVGKRSEEEVVEDTKESQDSLQASTTVSELPVAQDQSSTPPAREQFDPEAQYRKLQEQLGLISKSPIPQDEEQPQTAPANPFGASLGFKSMLPARQTRIGLDKSLPKFEGQSVFRPSGVGRKR